MSTVQAHGTAVAAAPGGDEQVGDREAPARPHRPGRLAGLDGLRALAILAVLVFHLDPSWLPGGFLGVDVFFVVSGFLITTLLVRERTTTGAIDLPGFWARRARRLLPALLLCVPAAVLLARLSEGDLLVGIERQVAGAFTFTSNWLEIAAGSDYFAATSPQLLMNLWSLAVEEQFYLLWPLAVLGLLAVTRRPETRAAAALGLAVLSAALMALRLDPESPTRVYYGTDTHVMGLMLGAALAFAYAAPHRAWTTSAWWAAHRRHVAAVSLVTLLGLMALGGEDSALTFRGGILLASLATTALLLVVVERPGRLRAVLELPPARWVGARSYGIYLWHWPVFLVIGADLPVAPGGTTYLLTRLWCVVVTFVVADLSYRFVETPVRRHGFAGSVRLGTARLRRLGTRGARIIWSVALVLVVALVAVLLTAPDRTSTEQLIATNEAELVDTAPAPSPAPTPGSTPAKADDAAQGRPCGLDDAQGQRDRRVRRLDDGRRRPRAALLPAQGAGQREVEPEVARGAGPRQGPRRLAAPRRRARVRHQRRHRREGRPAHPERDRAEPDGRHRHRARPFRPRRDRQRHAARDRQGHAERAPRRVGCRPGRHQRAAPARRHPPEPEGLAPLRQDGPPGVRGAVAGAHREAGDAQGAAAALTSRVEPAGWVRCHHAVMIGSGQATLVGRDDELAVLRAALAAAAAGRPGAVLVAGDAGVGKTRLVRALRESAAVAPAAMLLGAQCVDLGDPGLPYLALTDLLRGVRARAGSDPEVAAAVARAPVLAGLVDPGASAVDGLDESHRLRVLDATATLLAELGRLRGPVVVTVEDLQWVDASSAQLLRFLLSRVTSERLLVVATVRTDGLAAHPLARRLRR